jgi:hypothetical protein
VLESLFGKYGGKVWTRGTSGGLLWTQQWTFGFHKRRGISWLAEWLLTSQEGFCSLELVIRNTYAWNMSLPCICKLPITSKHSAVLMKLSRSRSHDTGAMFLTSLVQRCWRGVR